MIQRQILHEYQTELHTKILSNKKYNLPLDEINSAVDKLFFASILSHSYVTNTNIDISFQ